MYMNKKIMYIGKENKCSCPFIDTIPFDPVAPLSQPVIKKKGFAPENCFLVTGTQKFNKDKQKNNRLALTSLKSSIYYV